MKIDDHSRVSDVPNEYRCARSRSARCKERCTASIVNSQDIIPLGWRVQSTWITYITGFPCGVARGNGFLCLCLGPMKLDFLCVHPALWKYPSPACLFNWYCLGGVCSNWIFVFEIIDFSHGIARILIPLSLFPFSFVPSVSILSGVTWTSW